MDPRKLSDRLIRVLLSKDGEGPPPTEPFAILLLLQVIELMSSSGANQVEARCALEAAIAMIPEIGLPIKPTCVVGS